MGIAQPTSKQSWGDPQGPSPRNGMEAQGNVRTAHAGEFAQNILCDLSTSLPEQDFPAGTRHLLNLSLLSCSAY